MIRPISILLVGLAFLSACGPSAAGDGQGKADVLSAVKNFHSDFTSPTYAASPERSAVIVPKLRPLEEVSLPKDGSYGAPGLVSVNGQRHREVKCDGLLESHGGNSMDIAVRGITVIAINTVEGGKAVATSDIVIQPVQSLCRSCEGEVEEKLR